MSRNNSFGDSFKSIKSKAKLINSDHFKIMEAEEKDETDKEVIIKDGPGEEEKNGDYNYLLSDRELYVVEESSHDSPRRRIDLTVKDETSEVSLEI